MLQLLPRELPLKVVYGNAKELLTLAKGDFHAVHEESGKSFQVGRIQDLCRYRFVCMVTAAYVREFHIRRVCWCVQIQRTIEEDQWNCFCGNWMPASYKKKCVLCTTPFQPK